MGSDSRADHCVQGFLCAVTYHFFLACISSKNVFQAGPGKTRQNSGMQNLPLTNFYVLPPIKKFPYRFSLINK